MEIKSIKEVKVNGLTALPKYNWELRPGRLPDVVLQDYVNRLRNYEHDFPVLPAPELKDMFCLTASPKATYESSLVYRIITYAGPLHAFEHHCMVKSESEWLHIRPSAWNQIASINMTTGQDLDFLPAKLEDSIAVYDWATVANVNYHDDVVQGEDVFYANITVGANDYQAALSMRSVVDEISNLLGGLAAHHSDAYGGRCDDAIMTPPLHAHLENDAPSGLEFNQAWMDAEVDDKQTYHQSHADVVLPEHQLAVYDYLTAIAAKVFGSGPTVKVVLEDGKVTSMHGLDTGFDLIDVINANLLYTDTVKGTVHVSVDDSGIVLVSIEDVHYMFTLLDLIESTPLLNGYRDTLELIRQEDISLLVERFKDLMEVY